MVFVSAGRRYNPIGLSGLGAEVHSTRGGKSLMGIGGLPIPLAISHVITELVSADCQYLWFLFIKS